MKTTTALRKIAGLKKKIKVIQGGQGASKTYSILMLLINHASSQENREIFVASSELTKMRLTVINDFKTIMKSFGVFDPALFLGGTLYNFPNGSFIKFIGLDKEDVGKGLRCDVMFVNECNKIKFETYRELTSRAKQTFLDFNPNARFWAHDEVITRDDSDFIILTYKDNEYLSKEEVYEIERYYTKGYNEAGEVINDYWANKHLVYALGKEGFVDGVIFQNWKTGDFDETIPIMYGIDFGFKDPFTLLKVGFDAKTMTIYLHEEIYKSNLAPNDIIQLLNAKIPNKDSLILADSADPTQIRGIKNDGFNIMGLGKEKIVIGIRHLQNWTFKVTPNSSNLIRELSNYVWLDKTGEVPIDNHNHCFTGDTMITTSQGLKRIDKVTTSDKVLTREGFKTVLKTFDNGVKNVSSYLMHFDTFTLSLRSTPNHKVKTNQGWKRIDSITEGMQLYLHNSLTGLHTTCTTTKSILANQTKGCTEKYGVITTDRYLKATTFTTLTATKQITQSKTYHLYSEAYILGTKERSGTRIIQNGQRNFTQKELKRLKNGTQVKRVKNGIVKQLRKCGGKEKRPQRLVKIAAKTTKLSTKACQDIVTKTVKCARVLEESAKKERVYDLMIADKHEYFANNILVHNCLDPLRYTEKFYRYKNS